MTDQEQALQIVQATMDETALLYDEALIAERRALEGWQAADRLYQRVKANDPDAIRQVLEGQQ
jgi:hypothetical protein